MSAWKTVKGVFRTFGWLAKEEWKETDNKFVKIAVGIVSFVIIAGFWYFIFRGF